MGSTPDASGSSVPAWPMRRIPVMRRIAATMSCEVGPTGLSRLMTPSIAPRQLALAGGEHPGSRLVEIGLDGAAGGPGVAPASELAGDGDRVGSVTGAHGDPDAFWFGFLEEQDDVCPLRQAHQIDETFGRAGIVLRLGEHRQRHRCVDDPPGRQILDPRQHQGPQAQGREGLVGVDRAIDLREARPSLHQIGGDAKRAGGRIRVGEGVRVLYQPSRQAGGQLRIQGNPQLRKQQRHDLAGGGRGGIDQVHGPESRIADVVIDVDQGRAGEPIGVIARHAASACQVSGIHDQRNVRLEPRLGSDALHARQEGQEGRDRVTGDDLSLLAEALLDEGYRQRSTQRIPVGALVADGGDALRVADGGDHRAHVVGHLGSSSALVAPGSAAGSWLSTSWSRRRTRSPASIESSGRTARAGTWRRRRRWPSRRCSHGVASTSAAMLRVRASSSPYTETQAVTWRRSPVVVTRVTVAKPSRGSFISRCRSPISSCWIWLSSRSVRWLIGQSASVSVYITSYSRTSTPDASTARWAPGSSLVLKPITTASEADASSTSLSLMSPADSRMMLMRTSVLFSRSRAFRIAPSEPCTSV